MGPKLACCSRAGAVRVFFMDRRLVSTPCNLKSVDLSLAPLGVRILIAMCVSCGHCGASVVNSSRICWPLFFYTFWSHNVLQKIHSEYFGSLASR